jgi:hypothetical protein
MRTSVFKPDRAIRLDDSFAAVEIAIALQQARAGSARSLKQKLETLEPGGKGQSV